jgi:hypothetical protein
MSRLVDTMLGVFADWSPYRTLDQVFQLASLLVDLTEHEALEECVGAVDLDGACHACC